MYEKQRRKSALLTFLSRESTKTSSTFLDKKYLNRILAESYNIGILVYFEIIFLAKNSS